ncbi:MAG: tRNA (adenosine(37)-N6)-threonylcarbamoyltransferase complex ATPase subunit type 1 TsaE [Mariniblastus sp.]|nr:tRNA (adenosine(37)-N6)-threonylcarbamoyltransferase complex ATPase subunit type 1 TsaE [Mariniblastus sp.]
MSVETLLIQTNDENQTDQLGRFIGQSLVPGLTLALDGELGAGKTRLTQAIASGLEIPPGQVNSPTFTLSVPHTGRLALLHVDAYRIAQLEEVDELDLDEWVESGGVLVVEWAERISPALPPVDLSIAIETLSATERTFQLSGLTAAGATLVQQVGQSPAGSDC